MSKVVAKSERLSLALYMYKQLTLEEKQQFKLVTGKVNKPIKRNRKKASELDLVPTEDDLYHTFFSKT